MLLQGPYRQLGSTELVMTSTTVYPSWFALNRTGAAQAFTHVVTQGDLTQYCTLSDRSDAAYYRGVLTNLKRAQRLVDNDELPISTFKYVGNRGRVAAVFADAVQRICEMGVPKEELAKAPRPV